MTSDRSLRQAHAHPEEDAGGEGTGVPFAETPTTVTTTATIDWASSSTKLHWQPSDAFENLLANLVVFGRLEETRVSQFIEFHNPVSRAAERYVWCSC
mmetsp:Transcript_15244/g.25463  ORF Transcript_15244/g.25463 Transcript_15244/m.25463 type:complete len:98 (+) Transcript_15244:39-332(+)